MNRLESKGSKQNLDNFFVFDVETGSKVGNTIQWQLAARPEKFIFACLYGVKTKKVFFDIKSIKKEFEKPYLKNKWIFAHNADYDLITVYDNVFDVDPNAIFGGSSIISMTNGNCKFANSFKVFPTSVKKIGEMIGLKKTGMTDNYGKSVWPKDKEKDIASCFTDCEIIWKALYKSFCEVGDYAITTASLSLKYFLNHHLKKPIFYEPENVDKFFECYYGGRTECFKLGKTHSTVIDINSSYPNAMLNCKFPNPKYIKKGNGKSGLIKALKKFEGYAKVKIEHPELWIGLLPFRKDKKLIFPIGIFTGCWTFLELRYAISKGVKLIDCEYFYYSPPIESPFKSFVDELWFKKSSSNNAFEVFLTKLKLNSLYGKLAQKEYLEKIYIPDLSKIDRNVFLDEKFIEVKPFNKIRNDGFVVMRGKRPVHSLPVFAAYITSYARVHLLKKLIEMEPNKVTYCDTDSIFFEKNSGIESEFFLGGWKIENKIVTRIRGLKDYVESSGSYYIKGVPKKALQLSENSYLYKKMIKSKEGLKRNIDAGNFVDIKKIITHKYDKRILLSTGETIPHKII